MLRNLLCLAVVLSLLGACSTPEGDFPSLAKRPYESDDPIAEPVDTGAQIATSLPAALASQVAALEARHRTAQAAYEKMLPAVQGVVSRSAGAAVGSEGWADANVQLSRLDYARADSVKVVGEMDELVTQQRNSDSLSGDPQTAPLLEARQQAIASDVEKQDAEINRLSAMLSE